MRKQRLIILISLASSILLDWVPGRSSASQATPINSAEVLSPIESPRPGHIDLSPENIERISDHLAREMARPQLPSYRQCNGTSDKYLELPLKDVDPIFSACADDWLRLTRVPIVLPPMIPQYSEGKTLNAFYSIRFTTLNRYSIGLNWKLGEFYQTITARFEGEKLTSQSPTLASYFEEQAAFARSNPFHRTKPGSVRLSRGIQGYYLPAVCAPNCHSAYGVILWDQNGYRYHVGLKMGRKEQVLDLVNAAIENQRSNP